jgi:acyl-CoA synthetase (AMP-forming)/AMP-acid ligase II
MIIWNTIQAALDRNADAIAVADGEALTSYGLLEEHASTFGSFLRAEGIHPGDRVAILESNSCAYIETYFAAAHAGAILVPLNVRLSAREVTFILEDAGARWLLASRDLAPLVAGALEMGARLERVVWTGDEPRDRIALPCCTYSEILEADVPHLPAAEPQPDDVAHLYYTSGTTGRPKGVKLTHANVCLHARAAIDELSITHLDAWGHIAPMFHLADAWATFAITWVGGRHVMCGRFDAEAVLATIEKHRITLSNLIPTMLNLMVKHPRVGAYDLSSMRIVLSGGAPIAPELVRSVIRTFGCDYIQTYGMTETSPYLTLSILEDHLRSLPEEEQIVFKAKTGRPFKAVELRVMDESGRAVAADETQVGEIQVRGPTITPGYWNLPEETEAAFEDGWLRTGDLAVLDAEGYVNIVDRKKDMIITGGENVYSIEVENALYMNPKVLEAAVFGVRDERWGESVAAAVVLRSGERATAEEIVEGCRPHLSPFKLPRRVEFLDELPKTGSGKISKRALRERHG